MKNIQKLKQEVSDYVINHDKKLEMLILLEIAEKIYWLTEEVNDLKKVIIDK